MLTTGMVFARLAGILLLLALAYPAFGQSASVTLGSGSGQPDDVITVSVGMTTDTGIAGFQFVLFDSLNVVDVDTVIAGTRVTSANAGLTLSFNRVNGTTTNVIAFVFDTSTISPGSGTIAEIRLRIRQDAFSGIHDIALKSVVLSDSQSQAIPVVVSDGTVTVSGGLEPDVTPPAPPTGLIAAAGDQRISLAWDANTEPDLVRYVVYRAIGITASLGDSIAGPGSAATVYVDQNLINDTAYSYRLVAVDNDGNRSSPGDPESATPMDMTPPAPPTGLQATGGNRQVTLSWLPNTESDLSQYTILRGLTAQSVDSVDTVPGTVVTYSDTGRVNGTQYFYRLTASDDSGNRSLSSGVVDATPAEIPDSEVPGIPKNLTATGSDGVVTLRWSPVVAGDLSHYVLYRSTIDGFTVTSQDSVAGIAHFASSFRDTGVANGTRFYYRIVAVDFAGNRSEGSTQASAIPDIIPFVRSVHPGSDDLAGGRRVTVRGGDFRDGASIVFGQVVADSVAFVDAETLTGIVPANTIGRKSLTVTNPSGISGTLYRGFLYTKRDSVQVVVKASSVAGDSTRVDTVAVGIVPAGFPFSVPDQLSAPVPGLQRLYDALAGMSLEVPSGAVVDGMAVVLNVNSVVVRGDSTIFSAASGFPSFFSVEPAVIVNGIERPLGQFRSLAAFRITLRLGSFNRILQDSGIDSVSADSLAFAYVSEKGLSQDGLVSRFDLNERRLIASLSRLAPLVGVQQKDVPGIAHPPVIVGGPFATAGDTSALITWRTDRLTTSRVDYGTDSSTLGVAFEDTTFVAGHAAALSGLEPRSRYYYRVTSSDQGGQAVSSRVRSFLTGSRPDTIPPVFVGQPRILSVSRNGAVIGWTTDEKSAGTVEFGPSFFLGRLKSSEQFVRQRIVALNGLTQNTNYRALVSARDPQGNVYAFTDTLSFVTLTRPDTLAPHFIRRPVVTGLTPGEAVIQWRTDEPGNSVVLYRVIGGADTLRAENHSKGLVLNHTVNLTGLQPNTRYAYFAVSADPGGNHRRSPVRRFRTPAVADTSPPTIVQGPTILYRSDRAIALGWVTDKMSDGFLFFRGGPDSTFVTRGSENLSRRHFAIASGLEPGTEYQLAISSTDASGNTIVYPEGTVVARPVTPRAIPRILFVTEGAFSVQTSDMPDVEAPVLVTGPKVVAAGSNYFTVTWETDEPSDSQVNYGPGLSLSAGNQDIVTEHQVTLTNLDAAATYQFQVGSTDPSGNGPGYGPTETVTTTGLPDTEAPVVSPGSIHTSTSDDRITISWETDEPADTFVEFGTSPDAMVQSVEDADLVTSHSLVVANLDPETLYYIRGVSVDLNENGPTSTGTIQVSTTAMPDTARPVISNVSRLARATTDSTAQLATTWSTDVLGNGLLEYGLTRSLGTVIISHGSVTAHEVTASRLQLNTRYFFRVGSASANDPLNDRISYGSVDSLVTPAVADSTAPLAPEGVMSVSGNGAVKIRWSPSVSGNVTGYLVLRDGVPIASTGTETEYIDANVVNGRIYTYVVLAVNGFGIHSGSPGGVAAAAGLARVPTAPNNGSPAHNDTVSLAPHLILNNATPVSGDPTRLLLTYEYQISDQSDFSVLTLSKSGIPGGSPGNPTNWQVRDTGRPDTDILESGRMYWWRSRADDSEFKGDWSEATSFIASTSVPTGITLSTMSVQEYRGVVKLEWSVEDINAVKGFHALRSETERGKYERISSTAIDGHDGAFAFTDHKVSVNRMYYYKIEDVASGILFGPVNVKVSPPNTFELKQNYPNPFNPSTTLSYELPRQSDVTLTVYNMLGQEVVILVNDTQEAGYHSVSWDGRNKSGRTVSSGLYFYRIQAGVYTKARKMLLLK